MKKFTNAIYLFKFAKFKISGVNLIGLMISSALGAFILAVIVRVSFTVSNNFQIIKATSELEASARIINNFFGKAFPANGYYNNDNNPTNGNNSSNHNYINNNLNAFHVNASNDTANFTLWYAGSMDGTTPGIDGTLLCSRQPVPSTQTTPLSITIFLKKPTTNTSNDGYATCEQSISLASLNSTTPNGSGFMPIISKAQIADFYVVAVVSNTATQSKIANLGVNNANATNAAINFNADTTNNRFNAIGIKLAILLKSTAPVFNVNRVVSFTNIFNMQNDVPGKTFNNTATNPQGDKYLYKLVIIESPFMYTINSDSDSTQNNKVTISS